MPPESRALRNLCDDITTALCELRKWRVDGNADKILYWAKRLDYLTDRLPRSEPTTQGTAQ